MNEALTLGPQVVAAGYRVFEPFLGDRFRVPLLIIGPNCEPLPINLVFYWLRLGDGVLERVGKVIKSMSLATASTTQEAAETIKEGATDLDGERLKHF